MLAFTTIIILVTKCDIVKELEVLWLLYKQMNQVVTILCGYGCAIYNNSKRKWSSNNNRGNNAT